MNQNLRPIVFALSLAGLCAGRVLAVEPPTPAPETPSAEAATLFPNPKLTGSMGERERLLGDFGGTRQSLAEHGLQFDFTLVQFYQDVASGGETDVWAREVGATAMRTLTGAILDAAAVRRVALQQQFQTAAQARIRELGATVRARFAALPEEDQLFILQSIAQVPPGTWENLRREFRAAFESKIASGKETLDAFFKDRIAKLNLGNFGNTGDNSGGYLGLWSFETKIDTNKMGLWPGGFVFMRVQAQYGQAVNARSGTLVPVNLDSLLPEPGLDVITIPALYFTQFLSEHLAVTLGKLDTFGGDMNEFAHISGDDRFIGTAFGFNPVLATVVPYSPLGLALTVLPTKDLLISLSVIDGDGVPTMSGFDTIFNGKTSYAGEARLTTNFGGKLGHQLIGGVVGSGNYTEFKQELLAFVPDSGVSLKTSGNSWAVYYNFDQYLWTRPDDLSRGWGIFGRVGFADESTNPASQFYSAGFGGKGAAASRPHDRWGLGWYYMKSSGDLPEFLQLGDEQGGEAFYTVAVTPAFLVSADIQVTNSARKSVDTAVILGLRATMRF